MGILIGLASIGATLWNGWNAWNESQARIQLAKQAVSQAQASYLRQIAEQKKMEAYFSYGVLGIGIAVFAYKMMR